MKMLSVRLDDQEAAALEALCATLGLSRSEVVKRAICDLALAARRRPFGQAAREQGLIGCFRGEPDLGERHQKHLKRVLRAKVAG